MFRVVASRHYMYKLLDVVSHDGIKPWFHTPIILSDDLVDAGVYDLTSASMFGNDNVFIYKKYWDIKLPETFLLFFRMYGFDVTFPA